MKAEDYLYADVDTINALPPYMRNEVKALREEMRERDEPEPGPTEEELWQCDVNLGIAIDYDDVKFPTYTTDNYVGAYYDKKAKEWVRGTRSRSVGVVMGQVGERKLDAIPRGTSAHNRYLQGVGLTIEQICELDTRSREELLSLPALPTIEDILVRLRFIVRETAKELGQVEGSLAYKQGKSAAKTRAFFLSKRLTEAVLRLRKAESLADYQPSRPVIRR